MDTQKLIERGEEQDTSDLKRDMGKTGSEDSNRGQGQEVNIKVEGGRGGR